jgi:cytochrome d ubiquinol oxidase subunit II
VTDAVAAVLFVGVLLYSVLGGADFGAGFWDLTAGGVERGRRPRQLIDRTMAPVWEANHVWLIFCLVVLWTGFPAAFQAITTTLYVPLWLAALGIVLRGSGFAFRKVAVRTAEQRVNSAAFAVSSVVTPFCFGAVAGGLASGRVPAEGGGDALTSWLNPTSLVGGSLAVAVCAYLAAVFLIAEARMRHDNELEGWFRRRALGASVVAGALALVGIAALQADARRLFDRLRGPGLPLVVGSVAAGLAALILHRRLSPQALRVLAVTAVAAVVCGWGVAQYPYLLGTHLTVGEAASPHPTLVSIMVLLAGALVLCGPSLVLLYLLQERGRLDEA